MVRAVLDARVYEIRDVRNLSYKRCRSCYVYGSNHGGDRGQRRNALSSYIHTVCTMHRRNRNIIYCTVVRKRGYSKTKKKDGVEVAVLAETIDIQE